MLRGLFFIKLLFQSAANYTFSSNASLLAGLPLQGGAPKNPLSLYYKIICILVIVFVIVLFQFTINPDIDFETIMACKGVIFDLDGTLVDSLEDIANSMNTVLENHHFPLHKLHDYRQFIGSGIRNLVIRALPETDREESLIQACYQAMVVEYEKNCVNKTIPYEGIPELLDSLVARKMKLAVFSNKADEFTKRVVSTVLPNWKFEAVQGLKDETLKKPNSAVAHEIAEIFGENPENIIYVGDSGVDMQTASNAGMYAAGVLWGFRDKDELLSHGARYLLSHPLDLLHLL